MENYTTTQLSVFLEDKTGELTEVTSHLAEGGISLKSLFLAEAAGFGVIRMIVNDPEKAKSVLKNAGFSSKTKQVLAVELQDEVGYIHKVLKALSENNINVKYTYTLMANKAAIFILKIDTADFQKAADVLRNQNIKVLSDEFFKST